MKKNKMMRVASALLVAVLMTTSVISGTFAKYVTQDSATDTARVAKWGVVLQVVGNLYGDIYDDVEVADNDSNIAVKTSSRTGDTNVVAPGTKNENGLSISLKGTPEVNGEITTVIKTQNIYLKNGEYGIMIPVDANKITISAVNFKSLGELYTYTESTGKFTKATDYADSTTYYTLEDYVNLTNTDSDIKAYYPVVYTLNGADTKTENSEVSVTADSLAVVAGKIANILDVSATGNIVNGVSTYNSNTPKTFNSNTDLAKWNIDDIEINWSWAFENGADDIAKAMYNGADTILANLMAGNANDAHKVVVKTIDGDYTTLAIGTTAETENVGTDDLVFATGDTDTVYACLNTRFSIDIRVEQLD